MINRVHERISMQISTTKHSLTTDYDISSKAFWNKSFEEREKTFAALRQEAPISWHRPIEVPYEHEENGFWAVTKAADISEISKNQEDFCSGLGITLQARPIELIRSVSFFLTMDPPEHTKYRRLVSAAFTPKQIRKIADQIEANATKIVDDLIGAGDVDLVSDCSSKLPLQTISDMVGIPESEREMFRRAAGAIVGEADPAFGDPQNRMETIATSRDYLINLGAELAAHRRKNPTDDLMTSLIEATIDGDRLTDEDIGNFLALFAVAGNDTTKQTTSGTLIALDKHPEQRAWLLEDFEGRIDGAIEEFVRYATPVMQMTRTALRDVEVKGQHIHAGDKVAMFYASGNRDEAVFEEPYKFDLSRQRNPHVAFGGGGIHYCLGNGVAKTQLKHLFREILTRLPNIEIGTPEILEGDFINGYTKLPAYIS